ncbi:MAG: lysylphosphatidylglycerol synthase domain-containing protein [Ilumatobacteraceae bacterium]
MNRRDRARLLAVAGQLIVAAAVVAAAVAARRNYDDVSDVISGASPLLLAAAAAAAAATVGLLAVQWRSSLHAVGAPRPFADVARWFALGQVGKYAPGGIWHVVGQGELARRAEVPARLAYGSVALSNVGIVAGGAAFVALGGLTGSIKGAPWWVAAAGAAALCAIALPPVRRRAGSMLQVGGDGSLSLPAVLRVAVAALPAWTVIGMSTWLVAQSFDTDLSLATVVAAASASWMAGILTLPAPGGLGVREAAFVALVSSQVGTPAATVVAVSSRLVFIAADLVCWVAARLWLTAGARPEASSTAAD